MVKKDTHPSPLVSAFGASLVLFYASGWLTQFIHSLLVCFMLLILFAAVSVCCIFLSSRDPLFFLHHLQAVAAGMLIGFAFRSFLISTNGPLITLSLDSSANKLQCILKTDPRPYGKDLYSFDVAACELRSSDGSAYSCTGNATVLAPKRIVEYLYPGKISGSVSDRIFFSSGTPIVFTGSFLEPRGNRSILFKADSASMHPDTTVFNPLLIISRYRGSIRLSLMRMLYPWNDAGGFLLALVSGEKAFLDATLSNNFNRTGLSHILALSGMHLSLIALAVVQVGKRVWGVRGSRILVSLVAILFVWFAGLSPSLNRALIMLLLSVCCASFGIFPATITLLAGSGIVQMILFPADILTLAFMLTYGALAGILTMGTALAQIMEKTMPSVIRGEIAASIGAQLLTAPILACSTGLLSPIGILASIVVSPLANVFMISGTILVFAGAVIPQISGMAAGIAQGMYAVITCTVECFARCNPLPIIGGAATISAVILPVAAGIALLYMRSRIRVWRTTDECFAGL